MAPYSRVMEGYKAIVYDLDGTLVHLDVDWAAVRREARLKLQARDVAVQDADLWELLERGQETGLLPVVEKTIAEHERAGARTADQLPTAQQLPHEIPTGVCSLNCEAACRIALEVHGLDSHVDAIVGRDSLDTQKPDPQPLLETIDALSGTPETTLFVGDTDRDAETAERAGVDFQYMSE